MNTKEDQKSNPIFTKGDSAQADYFTGQAWVKVLVPNDTIFNNTIVNVIFEPGCRNNWHTHPGGQILLCTDGVGYYQEKGKPIQVLEKGDVVTIAPDLLHWHGASPDCEFTHIAIVYNRQEGSVVWLDRVTDEEYYSLTK